MTDNITLRRWANANEDAPETEFQRGYDAARRWVREVGLPALAEPDATCSAKDNEAALERVANKATPGQVKGLLPEPDAKREPAADEQIVESYTTSKYNGLLYDFRIAWREAERHHGITKEDKT